MGHFGDAACQNILKQLPKKVAVAEMVVAVLGEGRVVGNCVGQIQAAEPAINQIEMNFFANTALRTDPHALADNQHPDHEFRIDRRSAHGAVKWSNVYTNTAQIDKAINHSQQVIKGNMILKRQLVK
jgi:hypothetical protein